MKLKVQGTDEIPEVFLLLEFTLTSSLEDSKPRIDARLLMDGVWQARMASVKLKSFGNEEAIMDFVDAAEAQVSKSVGSYHECQRSRRNFVEFVVLHYRK